MTSENSTGKLDQIIAQTRKDQELREKSYRERALKMYPWICGRCAREFSRENLRELTVHHRDHNHDNNPADGSNWELLCIYCHENEHARHIDSVYAKPPSNEQKSSATYKPFANLSTMLKKKKQ